MAISVNSRHHFSTVQTKTGNWNVIEQLYLKLLNMFDGLRQRISSNQRAKLNVEKFNFECSMASVCIRWITQIILSWKLLVDVSYRTVSSVFVFLFLVMMVSCKDIRIARIPLSIFIYSRLIFPLAVSTSTNMLLLSFVLFLTQLFHEIFRFFLFTVVLIKIRTSGTLPLSSIYAIGNLIIY